MHCASVYECVSVRVCVREGVWGRECKCVHASLLASWYEIVMLGLPLSKIKVLKKRISACFCIRYQTDRSGVRIPQGFT